MNISALIASFATGTYTVTRTARGTTTRGKTAAGTTSTLTITASVSPADGNDLMRLKEGQNAKETLTLFTATELYVGGQGSAYEADTVAIGSNSYEVTEVDTWNDPVSGGTGYKCLLAVV